ncbi:MAG: YebC/PmpR family DNA-binding transcriptional regulator [Proteobacteria bacterium]|jgi:YebC/PmpR family DNA-binding regulatory protein|nr:YebC/PmpR family DNA-binding transcriptional regulator [Alphaproteobacteria bacterium]NCC02627.1 YebC/PmpR family DNA-binding transcriptional regulator [Pseudomonadota bacterium]
MAGHSHAKNVMHSKAISDAKKGKIFNKIAREITVAVKLGSADPAANPRLRAALAEARIKNMTKDRIERAIKAGQPGSDDKGTYEEVRYEAYGPGGSALIIEALTDNRNRTAAEVRTALSKNGGNLGETGSVSFMFDRVGEIVYPLDKATADEMFEAVIEAGADNVDTEEDAHYITMSIENFGAVRTALEAKFGDPSSAKLVWIAKNDIPVTGDAAQTLTKLIDILEDNDDVQNVFGNYELPED